MAASVSSSEIPAWHKQSHKSVDREARNVKSRLQIGLFFEVGGNLPILSRGIWRSKTRGMTLP